MNTAHWHLLLNHLPVTGCVIGTLILLAGFILKNHPAVKRTALGVFVFSAVMAIPAYLTGEGAEEIAEKLAGVTNSGIEEHEDLGTVFFAMIGGLGLLAILTFVADTMKKKSATVLYAVVLVTAIATGIYAKRVATSGGEVRHTEIRSDAAVRQTGGEQPASEEDSDSD